MVLVIAASVLAGLENFLRCQSDFFQSSEKIYWRAEDLYVIRYYNTSKVYKLSAIFRLKLSEIYNPFRAVQILYVRAKYFFRAFLSEKGRD